MKLRPALKPNRTVLEGRYTRLEPLAARHAMELYGASSVPDAPERFTYLFDKPPDDLGQMLAWVSRAVQQDDPLFYAVIDKRTGRPGGRQALMRIMPEHGAIEIGSIYWGPAIARSRVATEALYLFARHVFEDLGYRRLEWKCDNRNEASKRAAKRFGFSYEGLFRQHMIVKGQNRDTAWFSIIDKEWPIVRAGFDRWLSPDNFDAEGQQKEPLMTAKGLAPAVPLLEAIPDPPAG